MRLPRLPRTEPINTLHRDRFGKPSSQCRCTRMIDSVRGEHCANTDVSDECWVYVGMQNGLLQSSSVVKYLATAKDWTLNISSINSSVLRSIRLALKERGILTHLASLNAPFLDLHRGDLIAIVITTSSSLFRCNTASCPLENPER
jgi:hypothetical protein